MALDTALSSGLQAFTAVRGEQRKQQLYDLQTQGIELRNEGQRLNNQFERETFGFRLDQARGNANFEMGRGRTALSEARQEEEIEQRGLRVSQEQEKDRYERNRANYWGSTAAEAASDARVALNTEESRADKIRSEAERAYQEALQAGIGTRGDAARVFGAGLVQKLGDRSIPEALNDTSIQGDIVALLEVQFDNLLSEGQRVAGLVYDEEAGGYMVATQMPDGSTKPITENRSSDPDDPVMVFSPDEVEGTLLGESVGDYRTLQAQRRLAAGAVSGQAEGIRQQFADDRTTLGQQRVQAQAAAEAIPTLRELDAERTRLRGRIYAVEQQKTTGFGSARINQPLNDELKELESELESVDSTLGDLRAAYGDLLDRSPEELAAMDEAIVGQMQMQDRQLPQSLRDLGGAANEARLVSQASGGEIPVNQAVDNTLGRGPSLAALTPTERVQNQADVAKANDTVMASVEGTLDRALETFQDSVDAKVLADRGMKQDDLGRVARGAWASMFNSEGYTDLISAASGSPRERIGVQVLLAAAANDAMYQGGDTGRFIKETLRGASPAVIRTASEFVNDDGFAGVPDGERLRAVDRAVELMETQGLNATQAKTQALQEMRNSR